eukprot:scaffold28841_cov21-Tisochrysis_lutea.AAC.2
MSSARRGRFSGWLNKKTHNKMVRGAAVRHVLACPPNRSCHYTSGSSGTKQTWGPRNALAPPSSAPCAASWILSHVTFPACFLFAHLAHLCCNLPLAKVKGPKVLTFCPCVVGGQHVPEEPEAVEVEGELTEHPLSELEW